MTEKDLESLWETLSYATDIDNIEYGEAVTIGSVFGSMKAEILKLQGELERQRESFAMFKELVAEESGDSIRLFRLWNE